MWFALGLLTGCAEELDIPTGTLVVKVDRDAAAVPAPGANVAILTLSATTDAAGTATFATVVAGTFDVRVTLASYCESTQSVTITDGVTTTVNVSLGTSPCATATTDQIKSDGSAPLYVLADIRTGLAPIPASCENDRPSEGTSGVADLLTNALRLSDGTFSCHGAMWLFTAGHAPWFDNTAGTFPWTNSGGDVLTVALPNRLRIPVTFWLTDFPGKSDYQSALVESLLPDANDFLYKHYTGLVLTNSDTTDDLPDIVDAGTLADPAQAVLHPDIGTGCSNTSLIVKSPVYKPEHLNVYVVEKIELGPSGINCVGAGAANVIFVDHLRGYQNLLHEIGHGLALFRPHWGHSDGLKDLYPLNLMDSTIDEIQDHYLSLGQIAWMHADANSWLNEASGTGTVRSRQFPSPFVTSCSCPDAPTEDCPALHADMTRPGAPNAGIPDRACHLTTSDSCVALATTGKKTDMITAEGWIDPMKSGPGYGLYSYSSLDPRVATVSFDSATGSFLQVKVTAVSNGSTHILLSLGGAFARVKVNVGSTCP